MKTRSSGATGNRGSRILKVFLFTDLHANLYALRAIMKAIQSEGYDLIVHTGDLISVGPHPAECLEIARQVDGLQLLLGNHELYQIRGIPSPRPHYISEGAVAHLGWVREQVSDFLEFLTGLPVTFRLEMDQETCSFIHYPLMTDGSDFEQPLANPDIGATEGLFSGIDSDYVFYGHDHRRSELIGRSHFFNPGSAGCSRSNVAVFACIESGPGGITISERSVEFERDLLLRDMEDRRVPDSSTIMRVFFGAG